MTMDRRTFLKAAAAAPCVFGLCELFAQDAPAGPEWFRQALARMKERKLYGVVIVAPEAAPEQLELGRQLRDLVDEDYPDVHEHFLTGVFVVMTPALAASSGVRKADEKENRFLLDPEGKRAAADKPEAKTFETPAAFAASFGSFLHGESGERLKARAEELAASAPAEVAAALRDLGADALETRDRASGTLSARAKELIPLYAWKRRTAADSEVSSRLRSIIERQYLAGSRLPFGTRAPKFIETCGGLMELPQEMETNEKDVAVDCGMGRIDDARVRKFLRFLTK